MDQNQAYGTIQTSQPLDAVQELVSVCYNEHHKLIRRSFCTQILELKIVLYHGLYKEINNKYRFFHFLQITELTSGYN